MTSKKIALAPSVASVRDLVLATEAALNAAVLERRELVRLMLGCAIAGENACILGEPGTGKSYLARALASAIDAECFDYLMTRTTTPDEIIGSPDMKRWSEQGERVLRTSYRMTSAEIVFLDEVFKSNSVCLNATLRLINERTYVDDLGEHKVPLRFLVSASNETPEPGECDAFFDRFLLRYVAEPMQEAASLRAVARRQLPPAPRATMTLADLDAARIEAKALPIDDATIDALTAIRRDLRAKGVFVSDRRSVAIVALMQALAWLDGKPSVTPSAVDVCRHTSWASIEQRPTVDAVVQAHLPKADALIEKISKVIAEQDEAVRQTVKMTGSRARKMEALGAVGDAIDNAKDKLDDIVKENPSYASAVALVKARADEVMKACNAATSACVGGA